MIHGHGGNIFEAASLLSCAPEKITDMSSNINPMGPMPGVLEYLKQNINAICRLPEANAGYANKAYADWQGFSKKSIVAGSGTTEILYLLPRALGIGSAVVVGPTYADYADALGINRADYTFSMRREDNGFSPDWDELARTARDADAVFFCNPNNPTGSFTELDRLSGLVESLPDTVFVIDESYLPFIYENGDKSMANLCLPNAVILQSLSKMLCIPGLRVGFCQAPPVMADKIRKHLPPWSLNALAQEAVSYISKNRDQANEHVRQTREFLKKERMAFYERLADIPGLAVFPSDTTFFLLRADNFTASEIWKHMLENRILIRDCSNFSGLDEHFFRISLKDPESNRLAAKLIAGYAGKSGKQRQMAEDSKNRS